MSKLIIETTGPFMLVDPITNTEISYERPTLVRSSTFIVARAALGQIRILNTEVPAEANDATFQGFLKESDGNVTLAIESYLSTFAAPAAPAAPEAPPAEPEAPAVPPPAPVVEPAMPAAPEALARPGRGGRKPK